GWFSRRVLLTWLSSVFSLGLLLILVRAANANATCLKSETDHMLVIDPKSSATYAIALGKLKKTTEFPTLEFAYGFSPDGTRGVYGIGPQHDDLPMLNSPIPPLEPIREAITSFDPYLSPVRWSPDGQWVALVWQEEGYTAYLAIADSHGNIRASK